MLLLASVLAQGCATTRKDKPVDQAMDASAPAPVSAPQPAASTAADGLPNVELERLLFEGDAPPERSAESYASVAESGFHTVAQAPLSTFSIDVDTASYANIRRFINDGQRPPRDAVRIEEMLNYFDYDYPAPVGDAPFATLTEVATCPWKPEHYLARIGIKGREVGAAARPAANLVFLIDVSGSMDTPDKLPLVQQSLTMLAEQLEARDRIAMVVYAGATGLALPSTRGDRKASIMKALNELRGGGSTNGGAGIQLAYRTAQENFITGGINRVILATDGDFNVGVTSREELLGLIEQKRNEDVSLTVLGFGTGNLKDSTLEMLADKGNGAYAYIDSQKEGRKVLVEQLSGTLQTIAKDVKIQVEFNPAKVSSYRLVGYENRVLAAEDFKDDKKDAGEIGAGHTVTALYEIVPAGVKAVEELRYQQDTVVIVPPSGIVADELFNLKLRYKAPEGDTSALLEFPYNKGTESFEAMSGDFKFASAVAGFGMLLRDSEHKGSVDRAKVLAWAKEGLGRDEGGYCAEFVGLVKKATQE
ncbi:MAG: von Willebrand factor type A domain-containing protein [Candidatus Hydrogenedentes bacterium]|nr:von Willebrand factor type A domain-containing protein [Candidatus Hydrogenedentota bacterium]